LATYIKTGLSEKEAAEKIRQSGFNELPAAKSKNITGIALEVIQEPMFLLLISCGILYIILGDYREGIVLLCTIFIIIFITFYQYQKTEKAIDALRQLSSPRALVIRDGKEVRIPGREVVTEDIILLHEGDRIPADAVLLEGWNLTVDESLLTGESVAVQKNNFMTDEKNHLLFSGTLVVQGKGIAKVLATGQQTRFGKIGSSLESIDADETRLQKEMKVLIRNLFIAGGILSVCVVLAFYFTRGNWIQSVLNGLAAAMAILPEEFPVVLTVFLALGAWRLARKKVLTRRPSAIETLGSATVLCSDKTGTITQNRMEIAALYAKDTEIIWSGFEEKKELISELVFGGFLASHESSIDPMEKAIAALHSDFGNLSNTGRCIQEFPLSTAFFAMTRVYENAGSGGYDIFAKGAPEAIFELCGLREKEIAELTIPLNLMAEKGNRILAVCKANWMQSVLPENQQDFNFRFLGFIGFEDPMRPEVPQAIKECREAGIRVIMITGDYPATAIRIAEQIGLETNGEVLTGNELEILSEIELQEKIKSIHVFARIIPEQKLQIIRALKANGEIVAMTGDGVNDAPALKAADIGVAMGAKGTDVAREASSLVLLDDNFASIVSAIRLGRKIFDNLQKAMSYIIAIHIPIIGLTLIPALFSALPLILMPLHIVFMELIIDPVSSVAFESEKEEANIMKRPPRNPNELFFGWKKILLGVSRGVLLFFMVAGIYFLSVQEGHSEGEVRAIAFSSLIIGNLFLILTSLSKTRSFISVLFEKNFALLAIIGFAMLMLLLSISLPALQKLFSFEFPGYSHFISSFSGALILLLIFESVKYFRVRGKNKAGI